jgi:CheY-like chemotaxis protein
MNICERIVLVDDNEADNVYHEIIIRKAGFKGDVQIFESGEDAIEYFRSDAMDVPSCIFLDINMPGLDGFGVAEQATPLLANKPAVMLLMLTSSGSPADRERAASLPIIKGYLTKPLGVEGLQELMAHSI